MQDYLAPSQIIELKNTLTVMLHQGRIEESDMEATLLKAGLARRSEGDGWIDERGCIYK